MNSTFGEERMSAIASFIRLPQEALPILRHAASPGNLLSARGQVVAHYRWSGYVLATLLCFLDERRKIDLMKGGEEELAGQIAPKLGGTCFIFTAAQKDKYLASLSADAFSKEELRDYFNKFNGTNEAVIGDAMLDGVRAFQQSLGAMEPNSVIIFSIG